MNGLSTRNTLHAFSQRHPGTMPEMDAIRRSDTVRLAKEAGIELSDDDGYHPEAIIVYGLVGLVLAVVGIVAWVV